LPGDVLALALGARLMRDGMLSRTDGLILVLAWPVGSALIIRQPSSPIAEGAERDAPMLRNAALAMAFMGLLGLGAAGTVKSLAMDVVAPRRDTPA
jgi:hypothetical protein